MFLSNLTKLCLLSLTAAPLLTSCDRSGGAPAETTVATTSSPAATTPNAAASAGKDPKSIPAPAEPSPSQAPFSRRPYLQLATQDSIHIAWRLRNEATPIVRWGTSLKSLSSEVTSANGAIVKRQLKTEGESSPGTKPLHSAPARTRQYEAFIQNLQPDTKYYYAVFDGTKRLTPEDETYTFRTLPVPGTDRPAWIWVAGDGGTGGKIQAAVHTAMVNYTKNNKVELDMFLHVGDMAYLSGLDTEFQGRFFEMYGETMRNTVCWPAMGNHEGKTSKGMVGEGPYYDGFICPTKAEAGGVASGREAYYSFDYGKIHFIVLDSCGESMTKKHALSPLGDEMMEWLKDDLEQAKADWLVAYWHHPLYTKGSHNSDSESDYESMVMREKFLPLLESAGVDLILAGHSHIYERSMLIDGAYATPTVANNVVFDDGDGDPKGDGAYKKSAGLKGHEGFVSIVTGNAGTSLKRMGTIPLMKKIILEHGSVLMNIKGDTLHSMMLNKDGQVSDSFSIVKSGSMPPKTRIANPKPAPPMPTVKFVKADGSVGEDGTKVSKADGGSAPTSKAPEDTTYKGKQDKGSTVAPPAASTDIIPRGGEWKYLLNGQPGNWKVEGFDDSTWTSGKAGFGYGDGDDATNVQVKGKNAVLQLRREFTLSATDDKTKLGLLVSYDDAFIVYINGHEVTRSNNITGSGASANVGKAHEADNRFEYWPLGAAASFLKPGKNVIGIEGYNDDPSSSDFSLSPQLILAK